MSNLAQGSDGTNFGGDGAGGGIYLDSVLPKDTGLSATNVVIGRNAVVAGAATTNGFAFGGAIFQQCPQANCVSASGTVNAVVLTHVTLADNSVSGATFNQGSAAFVSERATLDSLYGIVSGHTTPITPDDRGEAVLVKNAASAIFDFTLWHDNTRKDFAVPPLGIFTDTAAIAGSPDYTGAAADPPDYHILPTSAAIDEAVGSSTPEDFDGQTRPAPGGIPDLGADELPEPSAGLMGGVALICLALLNREPSRRFSRGP